MNTVLEKQIVDIVLHQRYYWRVCQLTALLYWCCASYVDTFIFSTLQKYWRTSYKIVTEKYMNSSKCRNVKWLLIWNCRLFKWLSCCAEKTIYWVLKINFQEICFPVSRVNSEGMICFQSKKPACYVIPAVFSLYFSLHSSAE